MTRTNHTLGTIGVPRCSICRHPDREDLDRDLVLKKRTQSEVAQMVGVDRSTVSRHMKNHVLPTLAEAVMLKSTDVALGNILEAFDMMYAEGWRLYHLALASGDLKLAHSLLVDQRKLLEVVVRYASQMKGANLQDIIGRDEAADARHYESVREELVAKLENLLGRHQKDLPRGDEYLNTDEVRQHGRSLDLVRDSSPTGDPVPAIEDAGSGEVESEPTPPSTSPATVKPLGPLTTPKKAEWEV